MTDKSPTPALGAAMASTVRKRKSTKSQEEKKAKMRGADEYQKNLVVVVCNFLANLSFVAAFIGSWTLAVYCCNCTCGHD
jgi:hypothetical protein